ncbi:MAG: hypothetical protein ACRC20_01775 [Segniliparus sp.]|uniref:hypothetical protein n=1 Tax=Segniliparus sp. TaxID=2804064 RepID=UPI003F4121A3
MPPLKPDPQALYDAGKKTVDASGALNSSMQAMLGALGSSTGMCGDDPAGIEVAHAYDKATKALIVALVDTVNGSARIGDGCQASAANYANANHASSMGPSSAVPLEFPAPTAPKSAKLPPSAQGGQDVPGWQRALEMLSGIFGPNGDPGKLHAAAGSWRGMAEACHAASAALAGPKDVAAEQGVPEADKMGTAFTTSITSLDTAAAQCASVAEKLDAQAGQITSTRAAIHDLAAKLGDPASLAQSGFDWLRGKGSGVLHQVLHDLDVVVGGFRAELSSLAHLLEPLVAQAEEFAEKMAGYADMAVQEVENLAYNVAAETVNTAATWAYAAATHPGDVLLVAGGLALAEIGAGGEVGGVALDATGVGAVVGIPARRRLRSRHRHRSHSGGRRNGRTRPSRQQTPDHRHGIAGWSSTRGRHRPWRRARYLRAMGERQQSSRKTS